jgi:hypothetical protein
MVNIGWKYIKFNVEPARPAGSDVISDVKWQPPLTLSHKQMD